MVDSSIILAFSGLLVIIAFYAGAFTNKHVKTTRNRSLGALVSSWYAWSLGYLCVIIAAILQTTYPTQKYWEYLVVGSFACQVIGVFSLILFIDENSQSRIGVVKIALISIIGSLYITIPLITTDQLIADPVTIYAVEKLLSWVQLVFGLFYFLLYLLWIIRMWKNSPKRLKNATTILLVVFFSTSITGILGYVFIDMLVLYAFHGGAILSILISIKLEPSIINILPFVANRLLVINQKSGVLLYEYAWVGEEKKSLSAFIHGIQRVSQDKFQVGKLKSLELDEGIVMLDHSEKLTYALLTTKSTKYLQLCFRNFKENFEKEVQKKNFNLDGVIDTADYEFGNALVENYFKYIPSRLDD